MSHSPPPADQTDGSRVLEIYTGTYQSCVTTGQDYN